MPLPEFKYHPDPLGTGSIKESDTVCECCGEARGFIYTGPVYAEDELDECLCPWCIADGSAHEKYDAEFMDFDGIGDYGAWEEVPTSVKEEVAFRTPGFCGWQQERWWTHCSDAAVFIGVCGKSEIQKIGKELEAQLRAEAGMSDEQWPSYLEALSKEGSPTAYVFQCRTCGKYGGYSDCN